METFTQLILKLDIAAKKAAVSGATTGHKKTAGTDSFAAPVRARGKKKFPPLSLKIKLLYLLSNGMSLPSDILPELCLKRSNLAVLIRELAAEKLITKQQSQLDKRVITLSITKKGTEFLHDSLSGIEAAAEAAFGSGYNEAVVKLADAVNILEFL